MNQQEKDEFTNHFMKQYEIIKNISVRLDDDLYLKEEEKIKNIREKEQKLNKIKQQLIQMYSTIISEF